MLFLYVVEITAGITNKKTSSYKEDNDHEMTAIMATMESALCIQVAQHITAKQYMG